MGYAEFKRRVLEVYEESRGVPDIAAGMLEKKYGREDQRYANINTGRIKRIWRNTGRLEHFTLLEHAVRRIGECAEECNNDHMAIADKLTREIKEYVPGYTFGSRAVKRHMEDLSIKPAKKPRYTGGNPNGGRNAFLGKAGKKITREERKRFKYGMIPEAI